MPALNYTQNLQPRNQESGRNYSIIFGVIAFLIITGCIFWGFFLPKYRKKHPPRPSATRYNAHLQTQTFPSHPALLRGFRKKASGELQHYNPRTQTPFPNTPPPGDAINLPAFTNEDRGATDLAAFSVFDTISSPARDRLPSRRGLPYVEAASSISERDRPVPVCATDYILPIPEPLALRPRSAGRAPTLAGKLSQFPMPRSSSTETGKLPHPRKLFEELEQRYSKTTTTTSLGTPSPLPASRERRAEVVSNYLRTDPSLEKELRSSSIYDPTVDDTKILARGDQSEIHSLSSGASDKRVHRARAGTITRPKTPVAEIRDFYDGKVRVDSTKEDGSMQSITVSSVEVPTQSTCSSYDRAHTPPTSPMLHEKWSVYPTLTLEARNGQRTRTVNTPTPSSICDKSIKDFTTTPVTDRLVPMSTITEGQKDNCHVDEKARPLRSFVRPRPARLNLSVSARSPWPMKRARHHSLSSLSSLLMPLSKSKRPSIQGSSVYSRDTRGISIARSPVTPDFSERASSTAYLGDAMLWPTMRKASSLELLRNKIDNWNLHTTYLDLPTSPSSMLKRALSDLGPRSPTFPTPEPASACGLRKPCHSDTERMIPKICIARCSDDIFRDPSPTGENQKTFEESMNKKAANALASPVKLIASIGSAPGGAKWI